MADGRGLNDPTIGNHDGIESRTRSLAAALALVPADRKAGDARYLEFRASQLKLPVAQQPTKKHDGFTAKEMDALANEGMK